MTAKVAGRTLALITLSLLASACDDSTNPETATVSLFLTDQAGDVEAVWIELGEIYLQGGGQQSHVTLLSAEDAAALGQIRITDLATTTLELASDVEIGPGNYGQLRFVIEGAVLETESGDVFAFESEHPGGAPPKDSLQCPSCEQTGIRVVLPGEIADLEAGAHLIVLDFDVAQSFGREAGASGRWVMHPVLVPTEVGFTGSITGTVAMGLNDEGVPVDTIPECGGESRDITAFVPLATAATLLDDEDEAVSVTAEVQSDSTFSFPFLHPDEYELTYVADVGFGDDTLTFTADEPRTVELVSGQEAEISYTIASVECR